MSAIIIDGTATAKNIRQELIEQVVRLKEKYNIVPGLATILVGGDPASQLYVGMKVKTCKAMGLYSENYDLPADISEKELLELIERLNNEPKIHGILVQVPLPPHIHENTVLAAINPIKDVDGFNPESIGNLMIGKANYLPCTPLGIQVLLQQYSIETEGADVVIIGRSNILGKPMAGILMQRGKGANATVDGMPYEDP